MHTHGARRPRPETRARQRPFRIRRRGIKRANGHMPVSGESHAVFGVGVRAMHRFVDGARRGRRAEGGGPEPEAGGAPTVLSAGRGAPPTKDAVVSISAARHYGRRRPFDVNVGVASGTRGRGARYTWRLRVPRTQTRPHSASAALTLAEEQTAREDGARASHFHYVASTLSIIKAVLCFFFQRVSTDEFVSIIRFKNFQNNHSSRIVVTYIESKLKIYDLFCCII